MNEKILIVEDDVGILTGLVDLLGDEGYEVSSAVDGGEALEKYSQEQPALILLDIMIPEKSGYDVCREIRKADSRTPILMLTAKGEEVDKVVGLELGADDYIVKPFGVNELLARIRAALRRARSASADPSEKAEPAADPESRYIKVGDAEVDLLSFRGLRGKKEIVFTKREIDMLRYFVDRPGEVIPRARLLEDIWGIRYEGTTRTLDQHIAKLRQKIEKAPSQPRHILTVHGVGYRFCP
jgi:DNA-binding response OmpR family regulator